MSTTKKWLPTTFSQERLMIILCYVYYKEVASAFSSVSGEVIDNTLLCASVSRLRIGIIILVKCVGIISSYTP